MQGGLAVAKDGAIVEALPLSIAGLMSPLPIRGWTRSCPGWRRPSRAWAAVADHPFMSLAFLALSVIPSLKLTDRGLVDVNQFCFVPLQEVRPPQVPA